MVCKGEGQEKSVNVRDISKNEVYQKILRGAMVAHRASYHIYIGYTDERKKQSVEITKCPKKEAKTKLTICV